MKQNVNPQGTYAGLAPAILKLVARGPTLRAKPKTAMATEAAAKIAGASRTRASDNPNSLKT